MGKLAIVLVLLALMGSARCYGADPKEVVAGLPVVGAIVSPPPAMPAYVASIGKEAPPALPEADPKQWFASDAKDALAPARWQEVASFLAAAGTRAGWTEVCKKVSAAAGGERAANPPLGALACSADASVTAMQSLAVEVLAARAAVALWLRGAPGSSVAAIGGHQGEIRLLCATGLAAREGATEGPMQQACSRALETAYLEGDGPATFAALGEAYGALAGEIAQRDPKVAPEPAFFDTRGQRK
ncbi:MAG: hypothetical protein IT304_03320 [Dehalococcoidia bacterium]|nr:hypothetical protein [Dehalococcoidia bacterium]